MICKYCDKTIPEDALFCPFCGEYLDTKILSGPYCALSGKKISNNNFKILKRIVIVHQDSESRGWYNQYTITHTRSYEEYFFIDEESYKKYKHSWRNLIPLLLSISLGLITFIALLVGIGFIEVCISGRMPIYQIFLWLIALIVIWYFIFAIVYTLLTRPFLPKFKEIGHATKHDAENYVLNKYPKIRKKYYTLESHGFYEDAQKLIDSKLKIL